MKRTFQQYLLFTFRSILFWVLAFAFMIIIRYFGIYEEKGVSILPKYELPIQDLLLYVGMSSIPFGIFYAAIEFLFDRFLAKRISLGVIIFTKTFLYLVMLIFLVSYVVEYTGYMLDVSLTEERGWWRTNKTFWSIMIFFVIASLVFSFIRIANEKFGRGVFLKMLLGKYRKPKEEKRIFMFLDLKSSTTIAENLGHYKYSQMIQDCFYDLNTVVRKFDAEIYQYVGDEAVLSWEYKRGLKQNNALELYFAFIDRIHHRSEYYQEKYNLLPEFKAGIHGGTLMVTEVGSIKKEIAYHGDVINTTARIQSQCNAYNANVLISESLLNELQPPKKYVTKNIDDLLLKGKVKSVNIYSVSLL
ncbi:adenylate and guanylate cyclase catalytic domain protein [Kordia sp. SMS9]|uniref:adenylate/guanylate cyclase domain-containing protein n=1 Tax=Kordia sp. SMS9 TaxID=2282170 RepID=UPI000E0CDA7F|nr:adenylate/guanylate cyclase domain-containing protein [Kordia sp. SMS9]AXG71251.1 adenylate and guanylate cyclase catalytic domain protein [Kordia sp. SMS9]